MAEEGADIADALATMWIRALDYMPPVHLRFPRCAQRRADGRLRSAARRLALRLREHMRDSFARLRHSPGVEARTDGIWQRPPAGRNYDRVRFESMRSDKDEVFRFIWDNREKLELQRGAYTEVLSVRPCMRIGLDGFVAARDGRAVLPGRAAHARGDAAAEGEGAARVPARCWTEAARAASADEARRGVRRRRAGSGGAEVSDDTKPIRRRCTAAPCSSSTSTAA